MIESRLYGIEYDVEGQSLLPSQRRGRRHFRASLTAKCVSSGDALKFVIDLVARSRPRA
jgi:hypothetical protein